MQTVEITWIVYGIIGLSMGVLTLGRFISTKLSTIILILYGIIGIILVFTIKNKVEDYSNADPEVNLENNSLENNSLENNSLTNINLEINKLQPKELSQCDTDNALYFNPLPYETKNNLIGISNDVLPQKYDPFNSTLIGPYSTNQISYKFNMA
jgi:hypothetical protein